jgi:hypothetical protein
MSELIQRGLKFPIGVIQRFPRIFSRLKLIGNRVKNHLAVLSRFVGFHRRRTISPGSCQGSELEPEWPPSPPA